MQFSRRKPPVRLFKHRSRELSRTNSKHLDRKLEFRMDKRSRAPFSRALLSRARIGSLGEGN